MDKIEEIRGWTGMICNMLDESVLKDYDHDSEAAQELVFRAYDTLKATGLFKEDVHFFHSWYQNKPVDFTYTLYAVQRLLDDQMTFHVPDFEPEEYDNVIALVNVMKLALAHNVSGTQPEIPVTVIIS